MRVPIAVTIVVGMLVALGCVIRTEHKIDAHIVVDIRHIEEQAENVLDFVEGKTDSLPGAESKPKGSSMLDRTLNFLSPMPTVYAAELKSASATVTELAGKMKQRFSQVQELKDKECFGEDNRGYLAVRDCAYCSEPEKKNEAQKLCSSENADRKALYKEIAQLNSEQNVTVAQVERVYAQKRLERAKAGEIFQLPPDSDDFKQFKASEAGKKLGAECVTEAWVTIK